jgi:predicted membrane-bound spermidine synthase
MTELLTVRSLAAPKLPLQCDSRYQRIRLARERGDLMFRLNGSPQVCGREQALYHEANATMPMARSGRRALVLGGGDGLAARNLLAFPSVQSVTLVELDGEVLRLWRRHPELAAMNRHVFDDPRLQVVVGDAIAWLHRTRGPFDVIVNDVEVVFTRQPNDMTAQLQFAFFTDICRKLSPGGVAVTTVPEEFDPRFVAAVFDEFGDQLSSAGQRAYRSARSTLGKLRILFGALFRHVGRWDVDLPRLGRHANFYLSQVPLRHYRRMPVPAPRWLDARRLRSLYA